MDAMQSITNWFIVKEALSLQGQAFQRLACWVLQHNPQPEVPFQVDGDNEKNKKLVQDILKGIITLVPTTEEN